METTGKLGWVKIMALILGIILIPYFFFGPEIESWVQHVLPRFTNPLFTILILSLLLIGDILLPIPSSLVSTTAGYLLGFIGGFLTSWAGMTLGSFVGYWAGFKYGEYLLQGAISPSEISDLNRLQHRYGDWTIIITRPVPVLAETSIFLAGMSGMPLHRFMRTMIPANLGISLAYAAVGAFSATNDAFLLAFTGALLLPGIAKLVSKRWPKNIKHHPEKKQVHPSGFSK